MTNRKLKEKAHDRRLLKVFLVTLASLLGMSAVPLVFML